MLGWVQVLLSRAEKDYPRSNPPPLRFIRSCSSSLAAATLEKLEKAFGVPVLEVAFAGSHACRQMLDHFHCSLLLYITFNADNRLNHHLIVSS